MVNRFCFSAFRGLFSCFQRLNNDSITTHQACLVVNCSGLLSNAYRLTTNYFALRNHQGACTPYYYELQTSFLQNLFGI